MNKVILTEDDLNFLLRWRDEHKDLVRQSTVPMKAIKIVCVDSGYTITCVREGATLRFAVNERGAGIGSLTFEMMSNGMCRLVKNRTKLSNEDRQAVLTVYCSLMALFVYGKSTTARVVEQIEKSERPSTKPQKRSKKRKRNGATYILGRSVNEPQMKVKGSHSSPSCSFIVRGHYRHYKSGKVIWIAEYSKGTGKKKSTTYRVGAKGE